MLRPDVGPRLLGVGSDLCWPPRPPAVGPEGLHELAQKVVALCAVTERALEGLPAAAADALAGRRWQDLEERERALQRRCVELDERERQMELAFRPGATSVSQHLSAPIAQPQPDTRQTCFHPRLRSSSSLACELAYHA